ncbi:MAG: hypothetical protein Q9161_006310 [Pseudevernia consocians]
MKPGIIFPALYYATQYGFGSILPAVTVASIFSKKSKWDTLQIRLGYGGALAIGGSSGELATRLVLDTIIKSEMRNDVNFQPEIRLRAIWHREILVPAGLLIYEFTMQYKTYWNTMAPVTRGKDQETMKMEQNAKITLYWLEKSRSQRILWLLEELQLTYSLQTYKRENMLAPASLKEVHPLGKSPLVSIESAANPSTPLILAESSFIVEYLTDHFGPWLAPERYAGGGKKGQEGEVGGETESWVRYRYFMHYAEGSLMPFLVVALILSNIKTSSPFFIRPLALMITGAIESKFLNPNLKTQWDFLESQLATSPDEGEFLCGADLTGADIMMSFPLGASKKRALFTEKEHPKLCAYVDRLEAMEGFKKAVQKIVDVEGSYESI